MKVWFSTYQLVAQQFNSQIQKNKYRKGALLRIRFSDDLLGYSDLCPYPEMGDHPLEYELKQMVMLKPSRIAERSIYFAKLDAEARKQKKSLYSTTEKIRNHFLVTDILTFDVSRIAALESQGYSEFKFKVGRDLIHETVKLEHVSNRLSSNSKMRLDFNTSLTRDKFIDWFEKNQKWLRPFLDYIEDPFAYNAKEWREVSAKWNIPITTIGHPP